MRDDLVFFYLCCTNVPPHGHEWVTERYTDAWLGAMSDIPADHKSQNIGRRAANTWLLGLMQWKGLPIPSCEEMKQTNLTK